MEMQSIKNETYRALIEPLAGNAWGEVMEFYVKPAHRANGYGKRMYAYIKNIFAQNGLRTISLTPSKNAQRFWQQQGFRDTERIDPFNRAPVWASCVE
jgi:GNAT superfamily N-acetyltransferase